MRFVVVGAGALGTIIAAHLVAAGHDVSVVARGARARTLHREGLRVRGLRDLAVRCPVVEDPRELAETDVLAYAVKTYHMEAAIAGLAHVAARDVLSVANGVMKNAQLAGAYGGEHVLGCMADTSGELGGDGVVEFTRNVALNLGPYQDPSVTDAGTVASALDAAGVVSRAVDDVATVEWSKLVMWIALFTLSIVARRPTGQFLSERSLAEVAVRLIKEAGAVAGREGVPLGNDGPMPVLDITREPVERGVERVLAVGRAYAESAPTHRMSALQDLDAGRRLEVEGTLGDLAGKARAHRIAAPTLETAYRLTAGIDALQAL